MVDFNGTADLLRWPAEGLLEWRMVTSSTGKRQTCAIPPGWHQLFWHPGKEQGRGLSNAKRWQELQQLLANEGDHGKPVATAR